MKKKNFIILCSFVFIPWMIFARESSPEHDIGLWVNADVAPKAIAGRWQPLFSLEYRSRDNLRKIDLFCSTLLMDYMVNKHLITGAGYEIFAIKPDEGRFGLEHRFYPEIIVRIPFANFSASIRARLQNTFVRFSGSNWSTRVRFKLGYKLTAIPLNPYISIEPYHHIDGIVHYRFSKLRCIAGFAYTIPNQQFDVYYLVEKYKTPFTRHVAGLGYCYLF